VGISGMRKLLDSPWQTLSIPFALTPIGLLHQSPPSSVLGDLGKCPSHQLFVWLLFAQVNMLGKSREQEYFGEDWKKGEGLGWCSSGLVEGKKGLWLGLAGLV